MGDGYLKRLARDLDRWIADGLVPAQNRQAILDSAAPRPAAGARRAPPRLWARSCWRWPR